EEVAEAGQTDQHPELFSIAGIFEKRHPFLVHTAGARDTFGTVRMFQLEAEVPVIVSHGSFHGHLAGEAIAEHGAPLNIGPRNIDFGRDGTGKVLGLVAAYEAAGNTNMSVQTDAGVIPQEEFMYQATLAERYGCSTWEALESINSDPADQILLGDQIGRLKPGLDADLVIKAGQPLDPSTPIQLVFVDGKIVYDIRNGQRY
ncbi:MAG: amidohydrolase family protein, partial [Planctomycetes bacterium]|nr:amidohydrolase family protein [Planctomycetota bacterium]